MRERAKKAAGFVGLALFAAGVYFAGMYLLVCEFARSVE